MRNNRSDPSKVTVFEKEVISDSNIKRVQTWSLFLGIWKHTNLCNKDIFSFQLRWPIETWSRNSRSKSAKLAVKQHVWNWAIAQQRKVLFKRKLHSVYIVVTGAPPNFRLAKQICQAVFLNLIYTDPQV